MCGKVCGAPPRRFSIWGALAEARSAFFVILALIILGALKLVILMVH